MSTTPQQRDEQLLAVGKQCSHVSCHLVDFLPFKCQHCNEAFCQDHYRVDGHSCPKYDESKHNRVAPDCPLCKIPIAIPPGQDPNVRMEQHFERECSIVTGRVQAKSTPLCARGTCKKVLFSPIRCDGCRQQFCPSHRFPSDHSCKAPTPNASSSRPSATPLKLPRVNAATTAAAKNAVNNKASEAVNSVKQGVAAAKASGSNAAKSMPFNKTDRDLDNDITPATVECEPPTKRPPPAINPLSSWAPRPLFGTA